MKPRNIFEKPLADLRPGLQPPTPTPAQRKENANAQAGPVSSITVLTDDANEKWIAFCRTVYFKSEVSLSARIEAFAIPWIEVATQKAPSAPASLLWSVLSDAIRRSGTHNVQDVSVAVRLLRMKYSAATPSQPSSNMGDVMTSNFASVLARLDTPIKRSAALAALVGAVLTIVGYLLIDPTNTWYNLTEFRFTNLVRQRSGGESTLGKIMFWIGMVLLIGGAIGAFTRIIDWVKEGSPRG